MTNFIKKIFCIADERLDKKRKLSKGIVGTQGTSWSQDFRCCVCEPIKLIRPPSPSQIKMAIKKCPNHSGNQPTEIKK